MMLIEILINHILPFTSVVAIDHFSKTCKAYRYVFNHEPLWKIKCHYDYTFLNPLGTLALKAISNIKDEKLYKHVYMGDPISLYKQKYKTKHLYVNFTTLQSYPPMSNLIVLINAYGHVYQYIYYQIQLK